MAVRGAGVPLLSTTGPATADLEEGVWFANVSSRWLHSDRHFRGDHEETNRQAEESEVVNDSYFVDLSLLYTISLRHSIGLTVPFVHSERSSLYEHDRVNRHSTEAGGLGDIRLVGYSWLRDPAEHHRWNVAIGLGVKAPTGDYRADDIFYTSTGQERRNVDQSIQPGDGGWGLTSEVLAVGQITDRLSAYAQGFYLSNPRDTNGAETSRSNPYEMVMSVPDQYSARAGLSYAILPEKGLSVSIASTGSGRRQQWLPPSRLFGRNRTWPQLAPWELGCQSDRADRGLPQPSAECRR